MRVSKSKANPFIEVDRVREPHHHDIMMDLVRHGKAIVPNVREKPWWPEVSRSFGHNVKKLKDEDGDPMILSPLNSHYHNFGVITTDKLVEITKQEMKSGSHKTRFFPKRKKRV